MLAAVVANTHRDPRARPDPWAPSDFFDLTDLLGLERTAGTEGAMTPTQIKAVAHAITGWATAKAKATR